MGNPSPDSDFNIATSAGGGAVAALFDPSLGSDASAAAPPNHDAALFTESAISLCMGVSAQFANQMAEKCNGLDNNNGNYLRQYLPEITLFEVPPSSGDSTSALGSDLTASSDLTLDNITALDVTAAPGPTFPSSSNQSARSNRTIEVQLPYDGSTSTPGRDLTLDDIAALGVTSAPGPPLLAAPAESTRVAGTKPPPGSGTPKPLEDLRSTEVIASSAAPPPTPLSAPAESIRVAGTKPPPGSGTPKPLEDLRSTEVIASSAAPPPTPLSAPAETIRVADAKLPPVNSAPKPLEDLRSTEVIASSAAPPPTPLSAPAESTRVAGTKPPPGSGTPKPLEDLRSTEVIASSAAPPPARLSTPAETTRLADAKLPSVDRSPQRFNGPNEGKDGTVPAATPSEIRIVAATKAGLATPAESLDTVANRDRSKLPELNQQAAVAGGAATQMGKGAAIEVPVREATAPVSGLRLADVANPSAPANNQLSENQIIEAMREGTNLSGASFARESISASMIGSSSLSANAIGYPPSMQIVDATGKAVVDGIGQLYLREAGAIYNPSTADLAKGNLGNANLAANNLGTANLGTPNLGTANLGAPNMVASNLGTPNFAVGNLVNNLGSAGQIKEGQTLSNGANSQGIAQALQGLLQQGQGAASKLDETGKAIIKGSGGPALTDVIATGQGGKKGSTGSTEGISGSGIGMPFVVSTTKGSSLIDGGEIKIPGSQTGNATNAGMIITATAGATTGQTGTSTTATGTAGTTTTNTTSGTQDPNATDIKALVTALPTVQIIDSKKGDNADDEAGGRPEIELDFVENNDLDDDDDIIDTPIIEVRRADSNIVSAPKKPANIGLSIIENIMVLINDIKNQKVDDPTAKRMWADLFIDLFGKQKRQPCAVRPEDTLENIARFVLKDARLAPLLYTINVHAKNIKPLKKNESLAEIGAIKPESETILLPHRSEILRYKIHVLKETNALVLYAQNNRGMERDFTSYICRAGDTLKSIAASHIDVQNESMWADIALHNGLSARVDKAGKPIAQLKEGQLLKIPKIAYRDEYEEDEFTGIRSTNIGAMNIADINTADEETINKTLATMEKLIVTQSDLGSGKDSLLIKLELKAGKSKMRVAEWDVNATASSLKLYDKFGSCKIIPIALPTRAARELAENDLKANAERYCKMFLTGELAA